MTAPIPHRQLRIEAGAELRLVILGWIEKHQFLSDVEAAAIINAQAHSLSDQFLHARVIAEDQKRDKEQSTGKDL